MAKKASDGVQFFMSTYDEGIRKLFTDRGYRHTSDPMAADVVIFTGGADVTPFLYGERRHPTTHSSFMRDLAELKLLHRLRWETPKIGICRGAQFLNVTVGRGLLFQDVDNHTREHEITDLYTGQTILASSTHHQMMRPGPGAEILWVATESTRKSNDTATWEATNPKIKADFWTDPEVVYYDDGSTLCFQPHPEMRDVKFDKLREMFFDTVETYLLTKAQWEALNAARKSSGEGTQASL